MREFIDEIKKAIDEEREITVLVEIDESTGIMTSFIPDDIFYDGEEYYMISCDPDMYDFSGTPVYDENENEWIFSLPHATITITVWK